MRLRIAKKIIMKSIENTKGRSNGQMPICPFFIG